MPPEQTYAQVVEQSRQAIAQARLTDPAEHFPYKRDVVDALLADPEQPMGPGVPGGADGADDASRTIDDYMSPGIAAATDNYIAAQGAYLKQPSGETLAAYNTARDQLQAARLDHRQNRADEFVVGAAARRAG